MTGGTPILGTSTLNEVTQTAGQSTTQLFPGTALNYSPSFRPLSRLFQGLAAQKAANMYACYGNLNSEHAHKISNVTRENKWIPPSASTFEPLLKYPFSASGHLLGFFGLNFFPDTGAEIFWSWVGWGWDHIFFQLFTSHLGPPVFPSWARTKSWTWQGGHAIIVGLTVAQVWCAKQNRRTF